jgi:pSer/pThr/pTyr-binding forkhead associated (FHA) protein
LPHVALRAWARDEGRTLMSRLLLEISPERLPSNGASVELPPILICSREGQDAIALEGQLNGKPVILRIHEQGFALDQPSEPNPTPMGLGEWHAADGWRLRVTQSAAPEANVPLAADNPSWAAPELRITTYDGDRVKRLRCMLPTEEGSQLIVGRGGAKADLIIEDEHVSRAHLRFFVQNGQRMVEDLGSRWGTRLNGQPLTDPKPLQHGDEIRLGKSTINYLCYWDILPEASQSARPSASGELQGMLATDGPAATPVVNVPPPVVVEVPKPAPAKEVAKPQAAEAVKVEAPAKAAVVAPPKEAVKPAAVKRNYWGFDVGGAIIIVLLLLGGMAYLAYLVFKH